MAYTVASNSKAIGESNLGFGQNHVIKMTSGRVYAAFINDESAIEILYRDPADVNFTLDHTITGTNIGNILSLCKDNNDNLFICYKSGTVTTNVYKRTVAGAWSSVLSNDVTSGSAGARYCPIIISNLAGRIYVSIAYISTYLYIRVLYSDNAGISWSNAVNNIYTDYVSTNYVFLWGARFNEVDSYLYIYAGGDSHPYVVKIDSTGTKVTAAGTGYVAGTWYGGSFDIDDSGNRYQALYYLSSGTYYLNILKNETSLTTFTDSVNWIMQGMINIIVDYIGDIYVFYTKLDGKIYYRKYDLSVTTWEDEVEYIDGYRLSVDKYDSGAIVNTVYYQVG